MSDADLPTGSQYELRHGAQRAVVTEVGATLRHYSVDGCDIVEDFPAGHMSPAGHGQVLAPWPNRLQAGSYRWEGAALQLPLSEPERGNAIHGLVRWQAWTASARTDDGVTLSHCIHPRDGYPFLVDVRLRYALDEAGLSVSVAAANRGDRPAPFGLGFHPYLRLDDNGVDGWRLSVPADTILVTDASGIPTGRQAAKGTPFDFRSPRPIGSVPLDTAYTDLAGGPDNLHRVEITTASSGGPSITVWMDDSFSHVMVFSGDTLGPDRRRRALAVEPMTCPPNALASGESVIRLAPGATWSASWGISSSASP